MKLLRSFPLLAFVLVLLSIVGVCIALESVQLLLVAGTLAAMSWFITEGPRGRTLPRWVSNLLAIGVTVFFFYDFFQHRDEPMSVLGRFAVLLTLIKLYERKAPRDHAQLLSLSLLLMITGCLQTTTMTFGMLLIAYCVLGLYVLLLYQLHAAFEQNREARTAAIPGGYRLVPPLRPVFGRHPLLHFRSLAVFLGLTGAWLSVVVFVSVPREVGANLLGGMETAAGRRIAEFTNQVDLISGTRITENQARVMTVQLLDENDKPMFADEPLLLRGAIADRYEGHGRWVQGRAFSRDVRSQAREFTSLVENDPELAKAPGRTLRISHARSSATLFSEYAPVAVMTDGNLVVAYDPVRQTLDVGEGQRRVMTYSVRVEPFPSESLARRLTDGRPAIPAREGWFGDSTGRVKLLAIQLLGRAGVEFPSQSVPSLDWEFNRRAAEVFSQFLRSGEFAYTLDLRGVRVGFDDPVVNFLFESKRGHCEYFASALAALCQSVGVPARLALGYVATDFDQLAQAYQVRASNAHAWTEVMTDESVWSSFDPTPPGALAPRETEPESTLAAQVRRAFEQLDANWSDTIASFDAGSQSRMANALNLDLTRQVADALARIREWMARVNEAFYFGPAGYIWMGIVGTALVIAVIALVKLMRRTRAIHKLAGLHRMHGAEYQRMLRQLGFYLDMLTVLRKGGVEKPDWQPPLHFAQTVEHDWPAVAQQVRTITDLFYKARFGHAAMESGELAEARRMVKQLALTLRVRW